MSQIDLDSLTAETLAAYVRDTTDDQLLATVEQAGADRVLDRIFSEMPARFRSDSAGGVRADVVFNVTHGEDDHEHTVSIDSGRCTTRAGAATDPDITLTTSLLTFLKLIAGQENGPAAFMAGRLKVDGDIMLASRLLGFFETPKA